MIPFEDLCAALDAYAARTRGMQPSSAPPTPMRSTAQDESALIIDSTVTEAMLDGPPPTIDPQPGLSSHADVEEGTVAEGLHPVYEDRSNELDIGDVLSDEEDPS